MGSLGRAEEEADIAGAPRPHLVMFPCPALSHIRAMMQLAQILARRGDILVTFLNTEHNHHLILTAASSTCTSATHSSSISTHREDNIDYIAGHDTHVGAAATTEQIQPKKSVTMASPLPEHRGLPNLRLAALPDGLAPGENRTADLANLARKMSSMEPLLLSFLQELQPPATCLVCDIVNVDFLAIAAKLRITNASLWCPSIAQARLFYDTKLLEINGDVTPTGIPINPSQPLVTSYRGVPKIRRGELPWILARNEEDITFLYYKMVQRFKEMSTASWLLCNSSVELEREVVESFVQDKVNVCPIGPLFGYEFQSENGQAMNHEGSCKTKTDIGDHCNSTTNGTSVGFWAEEEGCLKWLDGQDAASVVYVSFGSLAMFNQAQLQELAMGLETSDQPFLWVVRADLMDGTTARLPKGFEERTRGRGLVVTWAPQLSVLAHRAIGCFVTHCGWNSTMEAVYNGVPTVAWPYFADQFMDREYLVTTWKVGRALLVSEDGLVSHECIKEAIQSVMHSQDLRLRAQQLGARLRASVRPGGASMSKLDQFIRIMWRIAATPSEPAP